MAKQAGQRLNSLHLINVKNEPWYDIKTIHNEGIAELKIRRLYEDNSGICMVISP